MATKLYSTLAHVYHEMHRSIFDYDAEFRRCDAIFKKHGCHRVLEIGCGTGSLAHIFWKADTATQGWMPRPRC